MIHDVYLEIFIIYINIIYIYIFINNKIYISIIYLTSCSREPFPLLDTGTLGIPNLPFKLRHALKTQLLQHGRQNGFNVHSDS